MRSGLRKHRPSPGSTPSRPDCAARPAGANHSAFLGVWGFIAQLGPREDLHPPFPGNRGRMSASLTPGGSPSSQAAWPRVQEPVHLSASALCLASRVFPKQPEKEAVWGPERMTTSESCCEQRLPPGVSLPAHGVCRAQPPERAQPGGERPPAQHTVPDRGSRPSPRRPPGPGTAKRHGLRCLVRSRGLSDLSPSSDAAPWIPSDKCGSLRLTWADVPVYGKRLGLLSGASGPGGKQGVCGAGSP